MMVNRLGVFWSPLRYYLPVATMIVSVCCKLYNFVLDNGDSINNYHVDQGDYNNVLGRAIVHLQDALHMERLQRRGRQNSRNSCDVRNIIAERLFSMGYRRTNPNTQKMSLTKLSNYAIDGPVGNIPDSLHQLFFLCRFFASLNEAISSRVDFSLAATSSAIILSLSAI